MQTVRHLISAYNYISEIWYVVTPFLNAVELIAISHFFLKVVVTPGNFLKFDPGTFCKPTSRRAQNCTACQQQIELHVSYHVPCLKKVRTNIQY